MGGGARSLLRLQALVSALLAASVLGAFFAALGGVTNPALLRWMHETWVRHWEQEDTVYAFRGGFSQVTQHLMLEKVPGTDHRRGGVWFLGASNLASGMATWSLEPPESELVHNYAIAGASFTQQLQFLRYLEEYEGLFASEPGKTTIVLGLSYASAVSQHYFPAYFRHGLFDYDEERGLRPVPMGELERRLRTWKLRIASFTDLLLRSFTLDEDLRPDLRFPTPPERDPERFKRKWHRVMGAAWREEMPGELAALDSMVAHVLGRGARVHVVLLPMASWQHELPFEVPFRRGVERICERHGLRLVDLSTLLADEEFADYSHYGHGGATRVHEALMEIARASLRRSGLL